MRQDRYERRWDTESFSSKRGDTLADDLDLLLYDLRAHWGYMNLLNGHDFTKEGRQVSAEDFATAVLAAEGYPQPELEIEQFRRFRRLFTERYGRQTISSADYSPG